MRFLLVNGMTIGESRGLLVIRRSLGLLMSLFDRSLDGSTGGSLRGSTGGSLGEPRCGPPRELLGSPSGESLGESLGELRGGPRCGPPCELFGEPLR